MMTGVTKKAYIKSPLGWIEIISEKGQIAKIAFCEKAQASDSGCRSLQLACEELKAYFEGNIRVFSFPMQQAGTSFQQSVWEALLTIPFGRTCSYLDLALKLGDSKKVRAVGTANGSNRLAIVVPCHRVIGSNGKLVGYAGGLDRKRWLLNFEQNQYSGQLQLFD